MTLDAVLTQIDTDLPRALDRLSALLRIPSISTDPAFARDCQSAADWLVEDLRSLGVQADARPTAGHPMVVGRAEGLGRHLLFYGHYDVQPVDPLDLWDSPPFEPRIEDYSWRQGHPRARIKRRQGTADDIH